MLNFRSGILGLTLSSALVLAIGSASAADMYRAEPGGYKDGPAYVPANTWTGFYIGVNGGYGWSAGNSEVAVTLHDYGNRVATKTSSLDNSNAGFGGGQIGYNWQHGNLVFGVEADLQGTDINGKGAAAVNIEDLLIAANATAQTSLDWFGTVRGRLGYAFDRTLVYATGGFAFGGVKDRLSLSVDDHHLDNGGVVTGTAAKDTTRTGFVLGGGIEYALTPAWSLKGEYQYIDLGSSNLTAAAANPLTESSNATGSLKADHTYHTARVGLNYHVGQSYEPLK